MVAAKRGQPISGIDMVWAPGGHGQREVVPPADQSASCNTSGTPSALLLIFLTRCKAASHVLIIDSEYGLQHVTEVFVGQVEGPLSG